MDLEGLKMEYFLSMLEKGVREVFARQASAAQSNVYSNGADAEEGRSGALREALQNPDYSITTVGRGLQIFATLPVYARFIDMKAHGNRVIYNKHLFGQLYKRTLQDIKYEFRDWVEKTYGASLREMLGKK